MINRTLINYEKCLDYPIIFNTKFKTHLIYYKKYIINLKDSLDEISLIMKVYPNKFYFKLVQTNTKGINSRNISFYEKYYDVYEIKKMFNKESTNNFDKTIQIINKELENKNIEIINDVETKIKIYFTNFNNTYIELLKIELFQEIKNHAVFINKNNISNTNINPNFIYKNTIINNSLPIFEIYYPFVNPEEIIIIYQNKTNLKLHLYNLLKNKLVTTLYKVSEKVSIIKHFFNQKNSYDYLCVSDIKKIVYVYNLSMNYKLLYQIKINYSFNIFVVLIFFDDKNNNNYLITSTYAINGDNYTKAFTLEDGGFIKNYPGTNQNGTTSLIYWFHKILKRNYIIELCSEKIFIYEMITNGLYMEFNKKENDFLYGCILENGDKKEYLYCSTYNNNIFVFDLYKKALNRIIDFWNNIEKQNNIYDIIKWSNKYIIISNYHNSCINIIDVNQNKIINCIKENDNTHFLFIKKIIHPIYGEALLTSSENSTIKLWI